MRPLACILPVVFLLARTASAQTPSGRQSTESMAQQQGPLRTIRGIVVNSVTSEPIPRALVFVGGPQQQSTFTDSGGRFQLENVSEGKVYIQAQRPGFKSGSRQGGRQIAVSAQTSEVSLQLEPMARIQGRITNEDGEPLQGVAVHALMPFISAGKRRWVQQKPGLTTDATGRFSIEDLAAGRYILYTSPRALFPELEASLEARSIVLFVFVFFF